MLAAGGGAADAAVAAVLASCAAETVLTGLAGGGFATYYDAPSRRVTCLDFFVAVPGLDGDAAPEPMTAIKVNFGGVPLEYSIGAPSVCVPGTPAGCGEVHRRWGRLPWAEVVRPAREIARSGALLPEPQAGTLAACAEAMLPGEGAAAYAPYGRLLTGGERLWHRGLERTMEMLAVDGPEIFYAGRLGSLMVDVVRRGGGVLGPGDLAAYRVTELPVRTATFAGATVHGRDDFNGTIATLATLPDLRSIGPADRTVALARALSSGGPRRLGDTTNIAAVDAEGNACVVTTTLGLGSGVWLPDLGVHLNSMLGEGELRTAGLTPGRRMASMMCPLVVTPHTGTDDPTSEDGTDGPLLAAGSAGASRIRSALIQTLTCVLVEGLTVAEAINRPRFHVVGDLVHAEPGLPEPDRDALEAAGFHVNVWPARNHYFGGVSAVGRHDAAGDPRRGGAGALLR